MGNSKLLAESVTIPSRVNASVRMAWTITSSSTTATARKTERHRPAGDVVEDLTVKAPYR